MQIPRRRHIAPVVVAGVALILAACGGDDPPRSHETTPTPAATSPALTPTPRVAPTPPAEPTSTPPPTVTATPTTEPVGSGSAPVQPVIPPPAVPTVVIDHVSLTSAVDKVRGLPADYVPPGLTRVPDEWTAPGFEGQYLRYLVVVALEELREAAAAEGLDLRVRSAYRSYDQQTWTFSYWVGVRGLEQAERFSARPGHSEHQLGTTIDFTSPSMNWQLGAGFAETPEGAWLKEHGHRFGFALSYPRGAEDVTGYVFEPWHWRYIGDDAAQAWFDAGRPPLITFLDDLGGR